MNNATLLAVRCSVVYGVNAGEIPCRPKTCWESMSRLFGGLRGAWPFSGVPGRRLAALPAPALSALTVVTLGRWRYPPCFKPRAGGGGGGYRDPPPPPQTGLATVRFGATGKR